MRYLLLIYGPPPVEPPSPEMAERIMTEYWQYEKEVAEAGVRQGSEALHPVETARTIEVRADGERVVTDGPFAETAEVLGGYYQLDVPDMDAALDWAARCPGAKYGSRIEVRPIVEFEEP